MRLILFDIDGTLLRDGMASKIAFARALRETYNATGPINGFKFAGMTDPECVTEIMRLAGIDEQTIHLRRDECLRRYVELLRTEMPLHDDARLYPGVRELLERLNKLDDVLVGLLTGNVLRGAELKLKRWDLVRIVTKCQQVDIAAMRAAAEVNAAAELAAKAKAESK